MTAIDPGHDRRSDAPDMAVTPIDGDTRWETYAEAGVRLGLTAEAVRAHAKRQRWPRHRPNSDPNGPVLVAVPQDFRSGRGAVKPAFDPGQSTLLPGAAEAFRLALEQAGQRADMAERARADAEARSARAETRSDRADQAVTEAVRRAEWAETDRRAAEGRADAAERDRQEAMTLVEKTVAMLTAERARAEEARQQDAALIAELRAKDAQADGLRDRLAGAQAELSQAQAAADRARAEAQAAQERADAAIRAECQQAGALQERLNHTERDLAVAQHDTQAAQEAAAELRLAEETRKARGRLRRAWDGWRGR
jgi:hypothetical protein